MNELNRTELEWALADADIPVLLMVLVHLTGDERWIRPPFTPKRDVRLFPDESGGLDEHLQQEVRDAVLRALTSKGAASVDGIDEQLYAQMMSTCVGEDVPTDYVALFLEEMGVAPSWPSWTTPPSPSDLDDKSVVVIGAGLSGICAAVMLQSIGIPYVVIEKNAEVGGTWWENTYPESGVDTPNHFYSYSFRPNTDWTSYFSKQPEVLEYILDCVEHYGIRDHIRFETEVVSSTWDHDECQWSTIVRDATGSERTIRSSAVIAGVGQLNRPAIPEFEGLDSFAGPVFHTAQWRHDVDLTGKRVAMIGAGASAMQVARTVAALSSNLTIFQRAPHWIAPNADYHRTVSEQKLWLLRHVPHYAQWYRFVIFWRYGDGLHRSLFVDPQWEHPDRSINAKNERHRQYFTDNYRTQLAGRDDLLAKTLPDYPPYGKRMLVDNDWFATIRRDDVDLVTEGVARITPSGIVDTSGTHHECDVIIMATGFHARKLVWPIEMVGDRPLSEAWANDNPTAHLGITVPGFPNLFLLHGPNTALAHGGSVIFHSECQVRYIVKLLITMIEQGIDAVDCRVDVHDEYVRKVDERHASMVWSHRGMTNWYRNAQGRIVSVSPWTLVDYWRMTHDPDLDEYIALHRQRSSVD